MTAVELILGRLLRKKQCRIGSRDEIVEATGERDGSPFEPGIQTARDEMRQAAGCATARNDDASSWVAECAVDASDEVARC